MKKAILTLFVALSTTVLSQEVPAEFSGKDFEKLISGTLVFTENTADIYSKISSYEVIETKKFRRHHLVAETRFIDGFTVVTVIDNKTGGNPLIFKYSHYVDKKKKGA